jgi:hypothetical protein
VFFKIIGSVTEVAMIASGKGVRERKRLSKAYGGHRWRKLKGTATVQPGNGRTCYAAVHWYEAHGAKEHKIKRILSIQ